MKSKFIVVFLIVVFNQACVLKPKQIISETIDIRQELGFAKVGTPKNSKLKKSYFSESYFCYYRLDLFEDSTFFEGSNCEGRMHFSLGKWKISNDSLRLIYTPLDNLNMIMDYSLKGDTSKFFVMKTINQNHEPIENLQIIGFKKGIPTKTALKKGYILTDKYGEIKIKKADFDSVLIYAFTNITNKVLTFKNKAIPDSLKLTLFFNSTNFCQFPTYEYYKDGFVFIIKNEKLITKDLVLKEIKI
ncbi:MAG: hypothetical protein P4L34_11030 [Paludibacter sp.]|nr:hypothetical protein [Paludibacter sp.]